MLPDLPPSTCKPDAKRRILVLTSTFPRWEGDSEPPFVFELSRRLATEFEVWVLAPHSRGAKTYETMAGLHVVRYRYAPEAAETLAYEGGITAKLRHHRLNYLKVVPFIIFQWLAARRLLRDRKFDLIHAHWLIPQGLIAALLPAGQRPPMLCTSHGGDLFGLRGSLLSRLKRFVLRRANHVTVVSPAMERIARTLGGPEPNIDIIPMGTDLRERFIPPLAPRKPQSLLFVGRLVEKKGLRYLLRALPPLVNDFPDLELTVVGDGPERPVMEQLARDLKVETRVQFVGRTTHDALPPLYQKAEICVFPSIVASDGDQEGLGLVAIEAMGCKCALVATRIPATETFLRDGDNAILVPPQDAHVLSESIRHLLRNPQLRECLGENARQSVLWEFDWKSITDKYSLAIQELTVKHK